MSASRSRSCSPTNRYIAEDAAALVDVTYDILPAAVGLPGGRPRRRADGAARDRHRMSSRPTGSAMAMSTPPFAARPTCFAKASSSTAAAAHSIEGRGILAEYRKSRRRAGGLGLDPEGPRPASTHSAAVLGLDDNRLRVATPDVGGGFGPKLCVYAEDVAVAAAAKLLRRSVTWIEDRREHFLNAVQERDQHWSMEIAADDDGRILGLRGKLLHDLGAYALQDVNLPYNSASTLTGPYVVPALAMDVTVTRDQQDAGLLGARRRLSAGLVRHGAADGPRRARTRSRPRRAAPAQSDPGRQDALSQAAQDARGRRPSSTTAAIIRPRRRRCSPPSTGTSFPARQAQARAEGRLIGIGLAHAMKGTGRGPFESGVVRVSPSGRISVYTGAAAMGQGLKTALAQICAERARRRAGRRPGDLRRHRDGAGRARRLRQPPDGDGRLVGAAGVAGGGAEGEEAREPRARGRRGRSRTRRRPAARRRRAATRRTARRTRAHPPGRAGLWVPAGHGAGAAGGSELPHRRARLCQCLPCRRGRGRRRNRRGA